MSTNLQELRRRRAAAVATEEADDVLSLVAFAPAPPARKARPKSAKPQAKPKATKPDKRPAAATRTSRPKDRKLAVVAEPVLESDTAVVEDTVEETVELVAQTTERGGEAVISPSTPPTTLGVATHTQTAALVTLPVAGLSRTNLKVPAALAEQVHQVARAGSRSGIRVPVMRIAYGMLRLGLPDPDDPLALAAFIDALPERRAHYGAPEVGPNLAAALACPPAFDATLPVETDPALSDRLWATSRAIAEQSGHRGRLAYGELVIGCSALLPDPHDESALWTFLQATAEALPAAA